MKYEVIKPFRDKYTGGQYEKRSHFESGDPKRICELIDKGRLVGEKPKVPKEVPKETPKKKKSKK